MSSFVMSEVDVEKSALHLWEVFKKMQKACEDLSSVFIQLTCSGGGLESNNMRAVFESRASEIVDLGKVFSELAERSLKDAGSFVNAVKTLDSGGLTLKN